MICRMDETEERTLPTPNPQDWTDVNGAAELLRRNRAQVYYWADRGVITEHLLGTKRMFWVPEIKEVADALARLAKQ